MRRTGPVAVGVVATTLNVFLLKSAAAIGVQAESGGLLRLLVRTFGAPADALGITTWWTLAALPAPTSLVFWLAFHYAVGLSMTFLYTLVEARLPGPGLARGSLFSLLPWAINGLVVLPLLGQGLFGLRALPVSGIAYFFFANWAFGATLGLCLRSPDAARSSPGAQLT